MTEAVLMRTGMEALVNHLGGVEAERFVSILLREPFGTSTETRSVEGSPLDYTEWRKTNLCVGMSVEDISREAMRVHTAVFGGKIRSKRGNG